MSQENVELFHATNRAWNEGHFEAVVEMLDPDVEWTFSDRFPDAVGTIRSKDAVAKFLRSFSEPWAEIENRPSRVLETGDHVVTDTEFVGRSREGIEVRLRVGHVWTARNGRVVRFCAYPSFGEALAAVGMAE